VEKKGVGAGDAASAAARRHHVVLDTGAIETQNRRHESPEHVESRFWMNVFSGEVSASRDLRDGSRATRDDVPSLVFESGFFGG